jgi:hypothetical protein
MVSIGKHLATTGEFGNPFRTLATGHTAVNPPLYPVLLALLFKLFGSFPVVLVAATIGNIVMNALTASWLPRVSIVLFGSTAPGVIAACLWLVVVQLMPAWDVSYTSAGLVLFCWYTASVIHSGRSLSTLYSGLLAGALVLLNPSTLFVIVPWLMYIAVLHSGPSRRALLYSGCVCVLLCVPASAWMARNFVVLGAPVLRTNLGMTLWVSNNDCAQPSLLESARAGCYQLHHPNDSFSEAEALKAEGEVAYDKRRIASTLKWIEAHPARFRELTLERVWEFWFSRAGKQPGRVYIEWLATSLSILGLLLMGWRQPRIACLFATVLAAYPMMYYIVVTDVRYRYPVLWLSFLAAGYFIKMMYLHTGLADIRSRLATT